MNYENQRVETRCRLKSACILAGRKDMKVGDLDWQRVGVPCRLLAVTLRADLAMSTKALVAKTSHNRKDAAEVRCCVEREREREGERERASERASESERRMRLRCCSLSTPSL